MSPTAIQLDLLTIRVYLGCWDKNNISRIGYIDLNINNPLEIFQTSERPVLDIGCNGTFDENGVFPGHVIRVDKQIYLYYTGFQLGQKIRHYNFGGLAISKDNGDTFDRYSQAPIIDRSDEGLFVRSGQSLLKIDDDYLNVYSAGSKWKVVGDKSRPVYNIFFQKTKDGINLNKMGKKIIECDYNIEHGLGRPQIIEINNRYYIFYTRRMLNMKYHLGYAVSDDLIVWERKDDLGIDHSKNGWDSEMVYFPSVIEVKNKIYLFYSGNNFGESGVGIAEIIL